MRRKPYKDVTKAKCIRCGAKARAYWETCALGTRQVAICVDCDTELNRVALTFLIGKERADKFVSRYARIPWRPPQ